MASSDIAQALFGNPMGEAYPPAPAGAQNWSPVQQYLRGMISLPQRAFESANTFRDTGYYDPAPILEAATLPMGTGAIAGLPLRAGEVALGAGPIRAYHGSPHDFSKFESAKIGTGEGSQSYGRGLYFADNPKVAETYKSDNGHMYEVNINADPADFLNWDSTLGQQPQAVQNVFQKQLEQFGPDSKMPAQMMIAGSRAGGFPAVSRQLADAGVPGIRYLDQGSRTAGEGTNNYVVFNDQLIDILKKYGLTGLTALGAAAQYYDPRRDL